MSSLEEYEETEAFRLRPHQRECVDAIVRALSDASSGDVRANVVMATGTGKTVMAAVAAQRLAPTGRVLVLVPTVLLLSQTVAAWRRAGYGGRMVAVCSETDTGLLDALGDSIGDAARCTTEPGLLARWMGEAGPVAAVATYASLVDQTGREGADEPRRGVLERAFGAGMPALDLLVVDEAHRTSGDLGKAWAAALDNDRLPAARRLAMTATPRLWVAPESGDGSEPQQVASMDSVELYGPRVFELELMEAVEKGLLARWEVDVLEITDPAAAADEESSSEEVRGRRLAALQAALLSHYDSTGVRSLLTFHNTTLSAMSFARALPETALRLHEEDPVRFPERVSSEWLSGEHAPNVRREVLGRFADGVDRNGYVADVQVLASCQVLAEGTDIRGRAGVDGVVFADPRGSAVQVVQIIGRALRQEPGEGKVARIIVPVWLAPGEQPDAMMTSPAYRGLVQLLQGLRAHDDRILQHLIAAATAAGGESSQVVRLDPQGSATTRPAGDEISDPEAAGEENVDQEESEDQEHDEDGGGGGTGLPDPAAVPLLRFSRPRDPAAIARFLRTRVLQPDSQVWLTGYDHLRQWTETHGDAAVPVAATVNLPDGDTYALGRWVDNQRQLLADGTMRPHRAELLDEIGMVWSVDDARFRAGLIAARAYADEHGSLAAPRDASVDGFGLGTWLHNMRNSTRLTDARREELEAIDPWWNPPWPLAWQRSYAALALLLGGDEARVPDVLPGVTVDGVNVGAWLRRQRATWAQLSDGQRDLLAALGIDAPDEEPAIAADGESQGAGGVPGLAGLDAFGRGVAACRQYLEREGHLSPSRAHEELLHPAHGEAGGPVGVRPGVFLSNQRARRAKLTPERLAALAALGLEWAQP
ncbi:DEAD/DEAH box helicase family protein [Streptomyces lonarensis]|uniref:DEAD/DEAH box helicase family protein n=1 Tax=Streptomyces lonarensis TaxID=700599 RepID=A0A7X6I081_9ACTN|nr:DEAD/DEAH box helicase family protein [Streptomyces lonarensis]